MSAVRVGSNGSNVRPLSFLIFFPFILHLPRIHKIPDNYDSLSAIMVEVICLQAGVSTQKKQKGKGGHKKKEKLTRDEMISNLKEAKERAPKKITNTKKYSETFWAEFKSTLVAPNPLNYLIHST